VALVLGAAFGLRATQVEVREADSGALVATGRARHEDFGAEVDDPTVWWRSLTTAVSETGQREIAAISVCGGHPGLVLLDAAGAVLRPVQPWADDESAEDAARLRDALGADRWARRVGALPGPGTAVSRLAWLRRTDPDTFARIGAPLLPHDWLTYRLAGRPVTDRGSASLTGAWSPAAEGWLAEVLERLAPGASPDWWRERLPEVLGPAQRADWLDAPVYELLGLRGRPLVGPGTGEAMAVALALGVVPGRVGISLGGSSTALAGLTQPLVDPTGRVRSRADATGRHLAISTVPGGASVVQALCELFELDADQLGAAALGSPPSTNGLVLVPGVEGRRGAVLTGLVPGVSRPELARAAFEGVACAALDALDLVVDAGATWDDDEPIRLAAPPAELSVHAQVLADLAGRPVLPAPVASLAAAGACIQAAAVLQEADPAEVATAWDLAGDEWVEPQDDAGRSERRVAHTRERARQRRAVGGPDA
jgi:xylulokinase